MPPSWSELGDPLSFSRCRTLHGTSHMLEKPLAAPRADQSAVRSANLRCSASAEQRGGELRIALERREPVRRSWERDDATDGRYPSRKPVGTETRGATALG